MAVSGDLGEVVWVIDDVLSPQEQDTDPATSLKGNCVEFDYRTDRNSYLALKLKFVESRG